MTTRNVGYDMLPINALALYFSKGLDKVDVSMIHSIKTNNIKDFDACLALAATLRMNVKVSCLYRMKDVEDDEVLEVLVDNDIQKYDIQEAAFRNGEVVYKSHNEGYDIYERDSLGRVVLHVTHTNEAKRTIYVDEFNTNVISTDGSMVKFKHDGNGKIMRSTHYSKSNQGFKLRSELNPLYTAESFEERETTLTRYDDTGREIEFAKSDGFSVCTDFLSKKSDVPGETVIQEMKTQKEIINGSEVEESWISKVERNVHNDTGLLINRIVMVPKDVGFITSWKQWDRDQDGNVTKYTTSDGHHIEYEYENGKLMVETNYQLRNMLTYNADGKPLNIVEMSDDEVGKSYHWKYEDGELVDFVGDFKFNKIVFMVNN